MDGWPLLAGRLAVTFALAELSYRLVEAPVRSGALERGWRDAWHRRRGRIAARWAGAVAVLLLGTAVLGTSVAAARPPERPAYLATEAIDTWQAAPEYVMAQPGPPEPAAGARAARARGAAARARGAARSRSTRPTLATSADTGRDTTGRGKAPRRTHHGHWRLDHARRRRRAPGDLRARSPSTPPSVGRPKPESFACRRTPLAARSATS